MYMWYIHLNYLHPPLHSSLSSQTTATFTVRATPINKSSLTSIPCGNGNPLHSPPFLSFNKSLSSSAKLSNDAKAASYNSLSLPFPHPNKHLLPPIQSPRSIPTSLSALTNSYPHRLDPYLPYLHDYFVDPSTSSHIVFIAQNMRRCDQGDFSDAAMDYWLPQISLMQPIDVSFDLSTSQYNIASSFESAEHKSTRFVCRFDDGSETLSEYFFDYELAMARKGKSSLVQEKRDHYFLPSVIMFKCALPATKTAKYVDLTLLRTKTRKGFKLSEDGGREKSYGMGVDVLESDAQLYDEGRLEFTRDNPGTCVNDNAGVTGVRNLPVFMPSETPNGKKYKLTACVWASSMYKTRTGTKLSDARERFQEWAEFQLSIAGIDHVYLYDNSDVVPSGPPSPLEEVANLFGPALITHISWPHKVCNNNVPGGKNPGERSSQYSAEASCLKRYGHETEWMMVTDIDEFIVPMGEHNDLRSVVDKFDEQGAKVLQFGSIRSKLRKEMTDIYSQQPGEEGGGEERGKCTCCEVGRASGRRPCRIKGSAHSYLAAYNCNVGHKDFGNRAQKQIFKPSYMVYHFVHYAVVTTSSLLPVKDGSSQRFRHPDNEVVTVYDEAVMIHAKGMLPSSAASNHCFGEDEDGKYIEGQLNQCLLGTEWYLDDAGERIRAESGEDVGRGEPRAMRAKR